MKRYTGATAFTVVVLAGLLTGCTSTANEYADKEVTRTGCDQEAITVNSLHTVAEQGIEGVVDIRRTGLDKCGDLYWARFSPVQGNTIPFEVILKVNDEVVSKPGQKNDPNKPDAEAWTKGYNAELDDTLTACVIPEGRDEICVSS